MNVWLKLGEDDTIVYINILTADSNEDNDTKLYDLSINDINSVVAYKSRLVPTSDGKWSIDNSKGFLNSYLLEQERKKKDELENKELKSELEVLTKWFSDYDVQVSEYNRDVALSIEPSIHVSGVEYSTIKDLYSKAQEKASRITEIRSILSSDTK